MNKTQQDSAENRSPFYKNLWFRIIALILAASMLFSLWAAGAIQIRIEERNEQDAAARYLIDNTEYIQSGELERLEEKVESYFTADELSDYYSLAGTQIAAGEYEAALVSIEKCLELQTGEDAALYQDLLLKQGCLYVLLGQYEKAVEALEKVLLENPAQADAYLVLAQIYAETGNTRGLIPVLSEYLKLRPGDRDIRLVLAQSCFEQGDYAAALKEYDMLLEKETEAETKNQILFIQALAHIQLEAYQQAGEILTTLRESDVEIAGLDYYLAVCHLSQEDYENGEICFTAAIEAGEMLQLSHYSRAVCRLMKEEMDYDGALEDLGKAIAYEGADNDASIRQQAESLLEAIQIDR